MVGFKRKYAKRASNEATDERIKLDRQAILSNSGSMGFFRLTWMKILIFVILVLGVGSTAAYLLYASRSGWKTYTNLETKYSIQYPPQYSIRIRDDLSYGAGSTLELSSPSYFDITIAVARNTNKLSLDNPRGLFGSGPLENYELPPDIEVKQAFLGGIRAFRLDHCCGGYDGVEAEIKALKDGKIYDIVVTPDSRGNQGTKYSDDLKNPDKKSVVEEIVSTFTFIQR